MIRLLLTLLALLTVSLPRTVLSHPNDLHLLEVLETSEGRFDVVFKPGSRSRTLDEVSPAFPSSCKIIDAARPIELALGQAYGFWIQCPKLESDAAIGIEGMTSSTERVIARVSYADGTHFQTVLRPDHPELPLRGEKSLLFRTTQYLWLGIEHFATGFDHVLFVLGLILLIGETGRVRLKRLVATVTLFTLAHSLTLSLATLGVVRFPPPLIESLIALSILALATELVKHRRGVATLGVRKPWLIAFMFGLLHGFGFAGALAEVGLPQADIPFALLFFNLGIELAQVLFVVIVLIVLGGLAMAKRGWPSWTRTAPIYVIGTLAMFWTIDRIFAFFH
jgi:hypothetical protein